MSKKHQLELQLLRYVPDIVKGTPVEIGAILMNTSGELVGFRFTSDWRRARCISPDTDIEALEMLGRHLQTELVSTPTIKEFRRIFENYVTSGLELAPLKGVETDDPAKELELIARLYLEEPPRRKSSPQQWGRGAIKRRMDADFEAKGVLKLLQLNMQVAPYTLPNDRFTIDYSYRYDKSIKMFHAVSVARDENQAVGLAIRHADLMAGIRRENKELLLTAVIEDAMDRGMSDPYALHALEKAQIHVVPVSEMPKLAEVARLELHA